MRKILFPFQKLLFLFFYIELLYPVTPIIFALTSITLLLLSLKFEGARPYTPIIPIIVTLQLLNCSTAVLLFIIVGGVIVAACKLYDINVPLKGKYLAGHRYCYCKRDDGSEILASVFYPTNQKGEKVEWIHHQQYNKVLYQIFHVDPNTKRIPYQIFKFLISYIHKIWLPAEGSSPFFADPANENYGKVILLSHGLGSSLNAYSSICCNWASQGYIVVSISHENDEICVDFRVASKDNEKIIRDYLFEKRNRDLLIRVKEMKQIYEQVTKNKFIENCVGEPIKLKEILLAGHSYGGATALATKAHLNKQMRQNKENIDIIKGIIALDPWLFPFDESMFENLKNQKILLINSQHFYEEVPKIYELEKLFLRLKSDNPKMSAFMVKKMDHLAQCDMAYVFGNILKFTGSVKQQQLSDRFMALNILMMNCFLANNGKEDILKASKQFVQQHKMDLQKVEVCEEYRTDRSLVDRQ